MQQQKKNIFFGNFSENGKDSPRWKKCNSIYRFKKWHDTLSNMFFFISCASMN